MKKLIPALFLGLSVLAAEAQVLVTNNGAIASVQPGCVVTIKTSSVHNASGEIHNAGRITIEGDYINDDLTTGGGSTGIFNVLDDWENNGTFTADQSLVNLNGANQLITGTSVTSFYDLLLNGSGIKSQTIDAEVMNTLELNDFELATEDYKMSVSNPATNAISYNNGFVSSTGPGRLERATNSTNTYIFPVGSSLNTPRYRPLEIAPTSTSAHTFAVRMANVDPNAEGFDRSVNDALCTVNSNFFHHVERTNGSDAADLTFFFDPINDGTWDVNAHWQNLPQWENMGAPTAGTNGPFTTLTNTGWNDFSYSPFALATPGPQVSFSGLSPSLCDGANPVILTGTPTGGTFSGLGVSGNQFNPSQAGVGQHTVSYSYTNLQGCESTEEMVVDVTSGPSPSITANGGPDLCFGDTITLDAGSGYTQYDWYPGGQTTQTIQVWQSGNFSVSVTDNSGCTGSSSNSVGIYTYPPTFAVISAQGDTLCSNSAVSYQWYFNGQPIVGETGQCHVAQQSGNYQVEIVDQYGCEDISSVVEFSPTTPGFGENSLIETLNLYPNPGSGQFIIRATFARNTKVNIGITNMLGQQLLPEDEFYTSEMTKVYDLEEFANGVYFVTLTTEDQERHTIRYIKN